MPKFKPRIPRSRKKTTSLEVAAEQRGQTTLGKSDCHHSWIQLSPSYDEKARIHRYRRCRRCGLIERC